MRLTVLFCLALASVSTLAQEAPTTDERPDRKREPATQPVEEKPVATEHETTIGGNRINYIATTGQIPLKDDAGKTKARIFFVAYERKRDASDDVATRPVTFVFNGGPGAASIWLHLGTAGPKRVALPTDGTPPSPPYKLQANEHSWLDLTDLVFIDPVGTGFSRPAEGEKSREWFGVTGDIESVGEFIRIFLTKYHRWPSPKFLAGESYGTTRAAGLSEHLHDRHGIDLNGIVLISTVLNFQTLRPEPGNDLPYPLFLPTYTASAWYHKKLAPRLQNQDLKKTLDEAQAFALGTYLPALARGASLADEERKQIIAKLAEYSGLPVDYVERSFLRVSPGRFQKSLLADRRKLIGRMDGRITGDDADPLNDTPDFDPSLTGYVGLFSSTFNDYVRRELKYEGSAWINYEFLSPRVGAWDFGPAGSGYLNVATTLRECMAKVPTMKVMLASGYYDFATPFTAADYTINQMPLSNAMRNNITHEYYEGGHMMYLNEPSLAKLKRDLTEFYRRALAR
jgi:carboxypeptidase C (cathepsin A)